jgi:cytochrome c peroxidase
LGPWQGEHTCLWRSTDVLRIPTLLICLPWFFLGIPGLAAEPSPPGVNHLLTNSKLQELGEKLFFDKNLSRPRGQSCATCHAPEAGWSGPDEKFNRTSGVYPGAVHSRFGNRKPTTAAYATLAPSLHLTEEGFAGGNFWDGRATGWKLSNPAADQAQGPFLNPVEQNGPNAAYIVKAACRGKYGKLFRQLSSEIWGVENICRKKHTDTAYAVIALAVAAFEHSPRVNAFSSKYDLYLRGEVKLTAQEEQGRSLFEGKGKCSDCHPSKPGPGGAPPLFTDFTYDNLGMPKNSDNGASTGCLPCATWTDVPGPTSSRHTDTTASSRPCCPWSTSTTPATLWVNAPRPISPSRGKTAGRAPRSLRTSTRRNSAISS